MTNGANTSMAAEEIAQTLMWPILLDGIRALDRSGPTGETARRWIAAIDPEWSFSFDNVCEAVGINPDVLRAALLRKSRRGGRQAAVRAAIVWSRGHRGG